MKSSKIHYRLVSEKSGRLIDLFDKGLSFKLMLEWKLLPPLAVMNQFLRCGRDDIDCEDGIVDWKPFTITDDEYRRLRTGLSRRGHKVAIDRDDKRQTYGEWFATKLSGLE